MTKMRAAILVATLVLISCSGGDDADADTTAPGGGGSASITIANLSFGDPITVAPGTAVTVTNTDGVSHTWTSEDDLFDSGTLARDAQFSFTFEDPGSYPFACKFHPSMTGSVTVQG